MKPNTKKTKGPSPSREKVRIIAGRWRGRHIPFVAAQGLRPSGDRIRETLFNWLAPHLPGSRCLDLFAGSGALGFEALSRGAAEVVMVDNNPQTVASLKQNAQALGADEATVLRVEAEDYLRGTAATFDIVFIDPPFERALWQPTLDRLCNSSWLTAGALIYIEQPRTAHFTPPAGLLPYKNKTTSQLQFALYRWEPKKR